MAKTEDEQIAAVVRDIESRVVWLVAFLVHRGSKQGPPEDAAKDADAALDEYQSRFPPIKP